MNVEIQGSSSHTADMHGRLNCTQEVHHDLLVQETARSKVTASLASGQAHLESITPSLVSPECAMNNHAECGRRPSAYRRWQRFCHLELPFQGNPKPKRSLEGHHQTGERPFTISTTELLDMEKKGRREETPNSGKSELDHPAALSDCGTYIFAVKYRFEQT